MTAAPPPPYERIGAAKVRDVVTALYDRLFVDPIVGFLFEGKDKARIVDRQVEFTCAFLGGAQRYSGKPLPEAHAALPLLAGHFDRRHHVLAEVLAEQEVPDAVRALWLEIDEGLRSSVLAAVSHSQERTPHA